MVFRRKSNSVDKKVREVKNDKLIGENRLQENEMLKREIKKFLRKFKKAIRKPINLVGIIIGFLVMWTAITSVVYFNMTMFVLGLMLFFLSVYSS